MRFNLKQILACAIVLAASSTFSFADPSPGPSSAPTAETECTNAGGSWDPIYQQCNCNGVVGAPPEGKTCKTVCQITWSD